MKSPYYCILTQTTLERYIGEIRRGVGSILNCKESTNNTVNNTITRCYSKLEVFEDSIVMNSGKTRGTDRNFDERRSRVEIRTVHHP